MGLFGNNDYKVRLELAKELAHSANNANKEIGEIITAFMENQEQFENVTKNILDLSQKIIHKLSDNEIKELNSLTETICELHKDYMTKLRMAMTLSENQSVRVEYAIEKYTKIKGI